MKRLTAVLLIIVMLCAALCGCSANHTEKENDGEKLNIVTTIFPIYDWVKNIVGDSDAQVDMLLDTGVDLHSFQPTVEDIMKISECDVFIYVGGESDKWVDDALKQKTNPDMIVIDLMDVLKDQVKEEEIVEGMEAEEEGEEEEDEPEYDEHIWLSLKNAVIACEAIRDGLIQANAKDEQTYKDNAAAYIEKLNQLDGEYEQAVKDAKVTTLVFGDRFPFRYMVDDYGLSYYAAFIGCSAESEASFETIVFLSGKVDELGLKTIMKIEGSDGSIAQTVKENTKGKGQEILTLDSLQSITAQDVADGASYLDIMQKNLDALKTALNN